MFGLGKSETEYGIRFGGKDTWGYSSKSEAERAIKRMNKNLKRGGTPAKLIQRTKKLTAIKKNPKDKCVGGKCTRRGNICKKHFRAKTGDKMEGKEWSLEGIHARWDEEGHRWG